MLPYGKDPAGAIYGNANVTQSQTDTALVAAQAGVKLRILKIVISGPTATGVTINSKGAGAGTAILGPLSYPSGGATILCDLDDMGWALSNAGEALTVTTGSGGTSSVQVVCVPVVIPPP